MTFLSPFQTAISLHAVKPGMYGDVWVDGVGKDAWFGFYDNEGNECDEYPVGGCPASCSHMEKAIVYDVIDYDEHYVPFDCLKRFPIRVTCDHPHADDGKNLFYIILLDPLRSLSRVKMGRSVNLTSRLRNHRVLNPELILVGAWPQPACDETPTMERLRSESSGKRIGRSEVFDVDLPRLIAAAETYFGAPRR